MKRLYWILALALSLAVTGAMVAGDGHKCSAETQTCLNKMVTKLQSRGWVGIEIDKNEESGVLTVRRVEENSPAMAAGLQEGDALVAMNGIHFGDKHAEKKLYEAKKAMTVGGTVTYTVDRKGCCHVKGGQQDVAVTLAALPEEILARWIGEHMIDHAAIELASN